MQNVTVPYGEGSLTFPVDDGIEITRLELNDYPPLEDFNAELERVLNHPTGSAPLLPVIVSILSGTCCVCTRQVTAQLSERTSLLTGTWFSYFTGLIVSVAALGTAALIGQDVSFGGFDMRIWPYFGGALGALAVFLQSICVKHMSRIEVR